MTATELPAVGMREPCPCGSSKRYKNCHGRQREEAAFIARPFAGIAGEAEVVAMLDLLASATADVALRAGNGIVDGMRLTLATLLPGGSSAYRAAPDHVIVGLQAQVHSADRSADVAHAVTTAASAGVGDFIAAVAAPSGSPRLQDIVAGDHVVAARIHDDFVWWVDHGIIDKAEQEDSEFLADMNTSFTPASRLSCGLPAYFLPTPERPQVRMVLADDESPATDAFARLVAAGGDSLGDGSKWLGNFRTCGLLAPVWDVPMTWTAAEADAAVASFLLRYSAAVAAAAPLSSEERRSRAAVTGKFVTLR